MILTKEAQAAMVHEYQCPGCIHGPDPQTCPRAHMGHNKDEFHCENHYAGTMILPGGKIYLGLPKGFNRVGALPEHVKNNVWCVIGSAPKLDSRFNIPVWKRREENGDLLVRVYSPRTNFGMIYILRDFPDESLWPQLAQCATAPDPSEMD